MSVLFCFVLYLLRFLGVAHANLFLLLLFSSWCMHYLLNFCECHFRVHAARVHTFFYDLLIG